ncbi:MAG: GNAT family N-acetyltransferase [Cyanobacteria bacterium]|nr:GNAT family N-acetyltransferase [Cyanobacteriota bacterium]
MANAVEANLFAFFQHLTGWPRIEIHDDADCFWTISDLPFPLFNSVMRARVSGAAADALIDARTAACRDRNVPMLWWTGPSTRPDNLGDQLQQRGFLFEPAHGMVADLSAGPPEGGPPQEFCEGPALAGPPEIDLPISIEPVKDSKTLKAWCRVLCDSFGAPQPFGDAFCQLAEAIGLGPSSPFRHFLARVNDRPAATCSIFFGAGVAGIYDVSTIPEKRKRGLGRAITAAALSEARKSGARMAILHSSTLGAGMYRGLGFKDVCPIGQYVWVPENFKQ